MFTKFKYGL